MAVNDTFIGFFPINDATAQLFVQITTTAGVPISPDSTVSYKIYSETGGSPLLTGTFGATPVNANTGFLTTPALNISEANGFSAGESYEVLITYAVSSGTNQVQLQRFIVT